MRKEFGYVSGRRETAACTFALNRSIPEYNCSTLSHLLNRHLFLPVSGNSFLLMWHPLPSYFRPFVFVDACIAKLCAEWQRNQTYAADLTFDKVIIEINHEREDRMVDGGHSV